MNIRRATAEALRSLSRTIRRLADVVDDRSPEQRLADAIGEHR